MEVFPHVLILPFVFLIMQFYGFDFGRGGIFGYLILFKRWDILFVELLLLTGGKGLELFFVTGKVIFGLENGKDGERDSKLLMFDFWDGLTFLSGGFLNSLGN